MLKIPKCLLCFLDDDYQMELRSEAQRLQSRHERALKEYKSLFEGVLGQIGSTGQCSIHNQKDVQFAWWIDEFLGEIKTVNLDDIFDPLTDAYISWISGELETSAATLNACLKALGYENRPDRDLDVGLYFRGRSGKHNRDAMLHIPFDMRQCISNQRYSLPGQPLLYLGLSIIDVICELQGDPLRIDDYSFSYYWLGDPGSVRILDIGNSLQDFMWNNLRPIIAAGSQIRSAITSGEMPLSSPNHQAYKERFITFVIAAMCSFRRVAISNNDKFVPEYVLPQLLAHWARKIGYDGIRYTSTRIDGAKWQLSGSLKLNRYRENLALFTRFNAVSNDRHDNRLLGRFEISDPVQLVSVTAIAAGDIETLRREIVALNNARPRGDLHHLIRVSGIDLETSFAELVQVDAGGRQIPYTNTDCGKIQLYLQYLFLNARKSSW